MGKYANSVMSECPFIRTQHMEKQVINCEGGTLTFHSKKSLLDYQHTYCDKLNGCKTCSIYKNLQEYYDRQK